MSHSPNNFILTTIEIPFKILFENINEKKKSWEPEEQHVLYVRVFITEWEFVLGCWNYELTLIHAHSLISHQHTQTGDIYQHSHTCDVV